MFIKKLTTEYDTIDCIINFDKRKILFQIPTPIFKYLNVKDTMFNEIQDKQRCFYKIAFMFDFKYKRFINLSNYYFKNGLT